MYAEQPWPKESKTPLSVSEQIGGGDGGDGGGESGDGGGGGELGGGSGARPGG